MQVLAPEVGSVSNARRLASQYWRLNRSALLRSQPSVVAVLDAIELGVEWVFARDGSVSGLQDGRWWADCSVPLLAGRELLRTLAEEPVGSCQLAPTHAGLVQAARERMGDCPVLFVAQPDARAARMILSCADFSGQIEQSRFWIAAGADWLQMLEQMFTAHPGLATPLRFIRTSLTGEEITLPMITEVQSAFSRVLAARGDEVARLKAAPSVQIRSKNILLVGGSAFRVWDFGTAEVERQLTSIQITDELTISRFDMDDALYGSPLALLRASQLCGSVVSADVCRADCNQLLPADLPWVTWMTSPGAPPFSTAGPRDALIVADDKWLPIARSAGWPLARVRACGWSVQRTDPGSLPAKETTRESSLGLICDTRKISAPASVVDFSSHRLLWELIEEELSANPLAVEEVDAYLANRAGQLNIAVGVLDRARFIGELILPAYQQGIARLLLGSGVSLRVWGKGWNDLPEFASKHGGAIADRAGFDRALVICRGLVYPWPTRTAHAIDGTGIPVVHRSGMDRSAFIRSARAIASGPVARAHIAREDHQLAMLIVQLLGK